MPFEKGRADIRPRIANFRIGERKWLFARDGIAVENKTERYRRSLQGTRPERLLGQVSADIALVLKTVERGTFKLISVNIIL